MYFCLGGGKQRRCFPIITRIRRSAWQNVYHGRVDETFPRRDVVNGVCPLVPQRQTYGDGLDQNALHPYMWAVKTHYYSAGLSFYNYPYMFGELFGLGLYARYRQDPAGNISFQPRQSLPSKPPSPGCRLIFINCGLAASCYIF